MTGRRTATGWVARRLGRGAGERDAGITLIEVVVSMTIMTVFMTMFTVGILQMSRAAARNQAIAEAQSQVGIAFLRLDKEIRYATGISEEGMVGANHYVEWTTAAGGLAVCHQMRLDTGARKLQWRTWNPKVSPIAPTNWIPLASEVESAKPFTRRLPSGSEQYQRLRIELVSVIGVGEKQADKATDITFTALNTSTSTVSDDACSQGRTVA